MTDVDADLTTGAVSYFVCSFARSPAPIYCAWDEFAVSNSSGAAATVAAPNSNFLKGVKWSPDGSCCLTVSDDNWLRIFDLPQDALQHQPELQQSDGPTTADAQTASGAAATGSPWRSGLQVHAGETVYDYAWFTGMSVTDPASCCLASTSRGQPIKVWDACNGQLRASYRAYDDADEITAATSCAFSPDGSNLVGGYNKALRVFDVSRPGRDCRRIVTYKKRQEGSIPGIISCLAFSPVHNDLLAAGSYSRCIGLFDARTYEQLMLLEGHKGGVTQVLFSPDGNFLYTGARQDDQIHCWDVRATGHVLYSMTRCTGSTNQRIGFSIEPCGRHLATGGCDGIVLIFDLSDGSQVASFTAAADTVNGVDFSPCLNLLATASGHRRFALLPADGWETTEATTDSNTCTSTPAAQRGLQESITVPEVAATATDYALQQAQQQQRHSICGKVDAVSQLSMASWHPGGLCNSLRLWRCDCEWMHAAAATAGMDQLAAAAADECVAEPGEAAADAAEAGAGATVGGTDAMMVDAVAI